MDGGDDFGVGDVEAVVVPFEFLGTVGEGSSFPEIFFREKMVLDHGAHGTVYDHYSFLEDGKYLTTEGFRILWGNLAAFFHRFVTSEDANIGKNKSSCYSLQVGRLVFICSIVMRETYSQLMVVNVF